MTMKKIVALFPGQGSHSVGMGLDVAADFAPAREVFETTTQTLPHVRHLIEYGPLEELTLTQHQQPALVAASIATYRAWQAHTGLTPWMAAGHSLGEYSALVAAGVLTLSDALTLTAKRGELMASAVPEGGAMSAVMGDKTIVEEVCAANGVEIANLNAPTQTVISGMSDQMGAATQTLKARGLKVIPLKVSAPFHCSLMQPAAEGLRPYLSAVNVGEFAFPVVANVTAKANSSTECVPELLEAQITGSVRWVESVEYLQAQGADMFVEFGSTVLSGLVRRILPEAQVVSVVTPEQIREFAL